MRFFLLFLFLNTFGNTSAQSIKLPVICHDNLAFLKCYKDGTDLVSFDKGNFIQYKRLNGSVSYSNIDKRLLIIEQSENSSVTHDTTVFQLLSNSLFVIIKDTSFIITSLNEISQFSKYFEPVYDVYYGRSIDGLKYNFIKGSVTIRLQTFFKTWGWTLVFWNGPRSTLIDYNSAKENRLEHFSIQDSTLKYGMTVHTTFRSLKKVSTLRATYVTEWIRTDGQKVIGELKLENPYVFHYSKKGKLKSGNKTEVCSCEY